MRELSCHSLVMITLRNHALRAELDIITVSGQPVVNSTKRFPCLQSTYLYLACVAGARRGKVKGDSRKGREAIAERKEEKSLRILCSWPIVLFITPLIIMQIQESAKRLAFKSTLPTSCPHAGERPISPVPPSLSGAWHAG